MLWPFTMKRLKERHENMASKLEKIGAELTKARAKRDEWDSRVKELERRYREAENTEIHELVHMAGLTPEQLAELLRQVKAPGALPGSKDAAPNESEEEYKDEAE